MPAKGKQYSGRRAIRRYRRHRANLANQVKNIRKQLKKEAVIGIQAQVAGTLVATTTPPTPVFVNPYVTRPAGVAIDGITAILKSVRIKGWFASVGANNTGGRIDVILDRTPQLSAVADFDSIYYPLTASGNSINQMQNPENKPRFKILASIRATCVSNDQQRYYFDRYIKMNHKMVTSSEGNWDATVVSKNAILICAWADTDANQMTYAYTTQCVMMDDN